MAASKSAEKSAIGAGVSHFAIGLTAFGTLTGLVFGGAQLFGDANAGSPSVEIALFSDQGGPPPLLKTRLMNSASDLDLDAEQSEPSLPGVSYDEEGAAAEPTSASFTVTEISTDAPAEPEAVTPLPKAPIAGLYENAATGKLPVISKDGVTPASAYARPFTPVPGVPRISLVLGGLGLKEKHMQAAIDDLPPEVTLSFVPHTKNLQLWINRARAAGHEVMLETPMEAYDYPNVDTGPLTLLTTSSAETNVRRLEQVMSQATGYFGMTNYQGAKFATDAEAAGPVFEALAKRGVAFIHDGAASRSALPDVARDKKIDFRVADRILDNEPSADAIDRQLLQLEALALQNGQAVGVGYAYPVTIEQFRIWTSSLKAKGYQLAPASSAAGVIATTKVDE
ncbi:MAG: divergent polysaccharide deacetylase family protein [Hyphomonadaceae bacterium]